MEGGRYAAVILAGGTGRRLGGVVKPALPVAGRPMLDRVLTAVADAAVRVVVGPANLSVPATALLTREDPPAGGPVAGAAAGLALVPLELERVALLAADLPLLDPAAIATLSTALDGTALDGGNQTDVALFVDHAGRRQSLCAMWRARALRAALAGLAARRGTLTGASIRALLGGAAVAELSWSGIGPPPWFDCDTHADLRHAEEWAG